MTTDTTRNTALILIDIQMDYFPGGGWALDGAEEAAARAAEALSGARRAGMPVLHVRHQGGAGARLLAAGTPGADIHPAVAPAPGEALVDKARASAFHGTDLAARLDALGVTHLALAGMMSNNCVVATALSAVERGLAVSVLHDACAAMALTFGGRALDGAGVHAAFMAELAFGFAEVASVEEWLKRTA